MNTAHDPRKAVIGALMRRWEFWRDILVEAELKHRPLSAAIARENANRVRSAMVAEKVDPRPEGLGE